jgi:type I restriction enzyme S subunit
MKPRISKRERGFVLEEPETLMDNNKLNWIANFIWGIADDVLRDLYVRGNIEYLAAVMEKLNYMPWISGAAQPKLTQDRLMSIAIAIPSREEQDRIIASATTEAVPLRVAINHTKSEISLLREYRTRLIADVVTGKVDVREAAMRLPEESDEPDIDDIVEETADNVTDDAVEEVTDAG